MAVPTRSEVPAAETWDVYSIFPDDAAWSRAAEALVADAGLFARFQGRLGESPAVLFEALEERLALANRSAHVQLYARMLFSTDSGNPEHLARLDRAGAVGTQVSAAQTFFAPELLALGPEKLKQWAKEDAQLERYAHYFDELAHEAPHVRSPEVEALLTQAGRPFGTATATHGILANSELDFGKVTAGGDEIEIVQGNAGKLQSHPDREVRRKAYEQYADAHLKTRNTMANLFAAGTQQAVFRMRARRYGSVLEMILKPHLIPAQVFHNLIATCRKHLPVWHRYYKARRKALGYEKLHPYDFTAPLAGETPRVSYEQAVAWILEGLAPLGSDYVEDARKGFTSERWVDRAVNKGKRAGAFSTGTYGTRPFIFVSYNDNLFSLSTLAHELGHSMHKLLTCRTQPPVYARYSLFAAEVASNFNQAMVREHLAKVSSERVFQLGVIEEAMANFHRYFFVMPTLARFEWEVYRRAEQDQALTAKDLNKLMADILREGYGGEVVMDEERAGITWALFSTHIYNPYYPFQYATGISGAHALARPILDGDRAAAERYLEFLKAGASRYPLEALQRAGVDLSSPEPVEQTYAVLEKWVSRLEALTA